MENVMPSKACSKCGAVKPITEYHKTNDGSRFGVRSICKECRAIDAREYGRKNRSKISERSLAWAKANPDRISESRRRRYAANPEKHKEYAERWKVKHPGRAKEVQREASRRRRATPVGKLEDAVRRRVNECIIKGSKFGRKTFDLLGYTVRELKEHIERQFLPGMSWDNRGEWEIDHIIPLSAHNYDTPDNPDFKRAWALTNLRPLWKFDNRSKGAKLTQSFQPSLALAVNDNTTTH